MRKSLALLIALLFGLQSTSSLAADKAAGRVATEDETVVFAMVFASQGKPDWAIKSVEPIIAD